MRESAREDPGMDRAVIAFRPRIGRAVLVALAAGEGGTRILERAEVALLPPGEFAPYHAAEALAPKAAREQVAGSIARARALATAAVRDAAKRCADAGYQSIGCAVLAGSGMPSWTTDEILAVHVRMHKAEGELFREVLVEAAKRCGLPLTTLPGKTVFESAARQLGVSRSRLDALLAALGKGAGAPWGRYQKEAAAAGLVALAARS